MPAGAVIGAPGTVPPSRRAAIGGVVGPATFAAGWWLLGRRRQGYSATVDPISRLAARGSPDRAAMTVAFCAYAAGVGALATVLARSDRRAAAVLAVNAASMAAVASLPLGAPYGDRPHVVAAGAAYASLAVAPLLGRGGGRRGPARAPAFVGMGSGALLALSQAVPSRRGLFQRLGLCLGHAWIVARAAAELASGRSRR